MQKVSHNEIIKLYQDGKSTRKIASICGVSHTNIIYVLKKNNIRRRSKKEIGEYLRTYKKCFICDKLFHPGGFGRHNRKTCSYNCYRKLLSIINGNDNHPNWKGGSSQGHYQKIARQIKTMVCEECGKSDARLDVHHINKDHSDNSIDNIKILCVKCHTLFHYYNGDLRIQGWNQGKLQESSDRKRYKLEGIRG